MNIYQKILAVSRRVTVVDKGGHNNFSKYDYARLGDIVEPLRPILQELGLILTSSVTASTNSLEEVGGAYYSVSEVHLRTTLINTEDCEQIAVDSIGYSFDKNGDKSCYKATTGARKYGISMLFGLTWDAVDPEEDDTPPQRQQYQPKQQSFKRGL